jgi:hypothetical protein
MKSMKNESVERKDARGVAQLTKIRHSFQQVLSEGSNTIKITKGVFGIQTKKLCITCKKIPFTECLPSDAVEEDEETNGIIPARNALIYYKSLSEILKCRTFCKFCELLFRSICEPEYDLLKAKHVREHLPDSDRYRNMASFSDWTNKNTYWKREWIGGAGLWPFGYAVDRQQAASDNALPGGRSPRHQY